MKLKDMSNSVQLFDKKGELLPPEQCNIAPLECLTKDRISACPDRRLPTRNGKPCTTDGPKKSGLINNESGKKEVNRKDLKNRNSFEGSSSPYQITHSIESSPVVSANAEEIFSVEGNLKKKGGRKMRSSEEGSSDELELAEKPIPLWTTDDVCAWLEFTDLQSLKDNFISHKVTGKTLLNLNYETLEKLNLSKTSEERENFLGAVYELQQEHEQIVAEQKSNKENQGTLLQQSLGHNGDQSPEAKVVSPSQNGSTSSSTKSLASSSQASSENDHISTQDKKTKAQEEKITVASQQVTANNAPMKPPRQISQPKASKGTSKDTKKRRSRTKRISKFWSSFHGQKSASVIDETPAAPFYKNVFHNLMNTGPQGVIKVWTEMFLTDMQYVSLLVRHDTTAAETVKMVLEKSNAHEDPECYRICEINEKQNEYILEKTECPLQRERLWLDPDNSRFELRWRNERLVEWSGSGEAPKVEMSSSNSDQDNTKSDERQSEEVFSATSPELDNPRQVTGAEFPLDVQVEYRDEKTKDNNTDSSVSNGAEPVEPVSEQKELPPTATDGGLASAILNEIATKDKNVGEQTSGTSDEPGSLMRAHKQHLTSSCPDLTRKELFDGDGELSSDKSGTEDDDQSTFEDEREYSQRLRTSSKNLSWRLKLNTERPAAEGHSRVQTGTNEGHVDTVGDSTDSGGVDTRDNIEKLNAAKIVSNGVDVTQGDHLGNEGEIRKEEDLVVQSSTNEDLLEPKADLSKEIEKLERRIKEFENENKLLHEDNRELKKSCRTFEGKSRLKEREMEELEEEKNGMTSQIKEMVDELHSLRAENVELKSELGEANTKLGDVDGWVTREVFEDIRGQLSLSSEEVEKRDEEIEDMKKTVDELKTENKKIEVLESEIENLNERIKEDKDSIEGLNKDLQDKEKQIKGLETDVQKRRASFKRSEKAKEELVNKLTETENEMNENAKKHADAKKDLQKRLSDREYEILIMKEEKKELCAKLNGLEGNIESLQEEIKKKEADHEAVIAEMKEQSDIKDESLSVTVTTLEQLVNERDQRIMQLKKQLSEKPQGEQKAKEHEYEQKMLYLKHLIALVREKDPKLLELLNKTLKSKDKDDWC